MSKRPFLRSYIIIGMVILLLIYNFRARAISKVINLQYDMISEINILNGGNGDIVELKDEDKIKEFITYVNQYRIRKDFIQVSTMGYEYALTFIYEDQSKISVIFDKRMKIKNKYYRVITPDFNARDIAELIGQ